MNDERKITVLIVEPMKKPTVVEISETLKSMQEVVGGRIEEIMPFDDEIAIVCNEEGKNESLPLNRALYNDEGEIIDVIAGKFFICAAPFESENFQSLTPEQQKKYTEIFKYPEKFNFKNNAVIVEQIKTKNKDLER